MARRSDCVHRSAGADKRRWRHKRDRRGQRICLGADLEHLLFSGHKFDRYGAWLAKLPYGCWCWMRKQANAISAKLTGGIVRDTNNVTNVTNVDSSGEPRESGVKKPYKAPSFRFEPVFEVSALACGKVFNTHSGCRFNRKAS